jgi:hypothetical protein
MKARRGKVAHIAGVVVYVEFRQSETASSAKFPDFWDRVADESKRGDASGLNSWALGGHRRIARLAHPDFSFLATYVLKSHLTLLALRRG